MRKWWALAVVGCVMSGCMHDAASLVDVSGWQRLKPKLPKLTPDVVELHYIFVEREAGNDDIDQNVWEEANEQAIALDVKNELNDNGIRVGVLGSRLSPKMHELLEKSNSSNQGRRHHTRSGGLVKIQMTEVMPQLSLLTNLNGRPRGQEIENAQGYLNVTPGLKARDSIQIAVLPVVEHGRRRNRYTPRPEYGGWQLRNEREAQTFEELKVELNIESGDYLIIGCRSDQKGTLGHTLFNKTVDGRARQTLLVIRPVRPTREDLYTAGFDFDDFFLTPIRGTQLHGRSNARETVLMARRGL